MSEHLLIGGLSAPIGRSVHTIRWYEAQGLVTPNWRRPHSVHREQRDASLIGRATMPFGPRWRNWQTQRT